MPVRRTKRKRHVSGLKSYTFDAPAHWASALINGDESGLDYSGPEAVKEYEQWCSKHRKECSEVVGTKGEPWIGRFHGLMTEMQTYTALSHVGL